MTDDLAVLDATGHAELIRRRELHPLESIEAAIRRIETTDPLLNSVVIPLFERARSPSRAAAGAPLAGVPFLLKDALCHSGGDPYHFGMRALREARFVAPEDTYLARRFKTSGLALCGKANTPELASASVTEPVAYGPTANPWDLARSPGGSSGGSASAVAAGLVPLAHGNDMVGSIRIPAAACGVVGLKPTRARITLGPHFGEYDWQTTSEFVLTRTVRDTALMLDLVAGPAPGDPYTAPPPRRRFCEELEEDPAQLVIGVTTEVADGDVTDEACTRAVRRTALLLEQIGHHVEESAPTALRSPIVSPILQILWVSLAREIDRWSATLGRELGPDDVETGTWEQAEHGRRISATAYVALVERLHGYARSLAGWWEDHDLLLTPTLTARPPRRGADGRTPPAEQPSIAFTAPFSVSGQPAINVPVQWSEDGLPIGIQLVAAAGREDLLIQVAAQLERAAPWIGRYPARPRS